MWMKLELMIYNLDNVDTMMMYSPETLDDDTSRGKWIDGACLFSVVVYTDLKHQAYVCGIARRLFRLTLF